MDFNFDELVNQSEVAGEIRKDPKKIAAQITTKSYLKATLAAGAVPTALCFALSENPVIAKPPAFADIKNATLVSSTTASNSLSSNSAIVVATTSGNSIKAEDNFIFKTVFRSELR